MWVQTIHDVTTNDIQCEYRRTVWLKRCKMWLETIYDVTTKAQCDYKRCTMRLQTIYNATTNAVWL
jgi:hypothetical protein